MTKCLGLLLGLRRGLPALLRRGGLRALIKATGTLKGLSGCGSEFRVGLRGWAVLFFAGPTTKAQGYVFFFSVFAIQDAMLQGASWGSGLLLI